MARRVAALSPYACDYPETGRLHQARTQPFRSPDLWRALDVSSPTAPPQVPLVGRDCPESPSPASRAACPPWSCLGPSARHPTYDVPIPTRRSPPGALSSSRLPQVFSRAKASSGPASPFCRYILPRLLCVLTSVYLVHNAVAWYSCHQAWS